MLEIRPLFRLISYWKRVARDKRERREMEVLGYLLKRELKQIRESTEFWDQDWARGAVGHDFTLSLAVLEAYQSYIGRLTVLPEPVLEPIVDAYLGYRDFLAMLWVVSEESYLSIDSMPGALRVRITPWDGEETIGSALDNLNADFDELSKALDRALKALERNTGDNNPKSA